ncbi:uncharacterized protein LOC134209743 [Armigeres subalbatus]|uniref:uncharacterized protein LOC134209743 n=1 Tax=Armigeres subalbatus TaxID=124917 RepID=UPI002ED536E8
MDELRAKNTELLAKLEELKAKIAERPKIEPGTSSVRNTEVSGEAGRPGRFELETLVSDFHPDVPTCESAESWLDNIESTGEAYGWHDITRLYCARMHLQGAARLWWNGVQSTVKTWATFKAKLREAFPDSNDPVLIHEQLMRRKKKSGETVETYFYDQVALGRKGKFDDKIIIKYIIAGIEDVHRAKGVTISMPRSLPELLEQLKWLDGLGGMRSSSNDGGKPTKNDKVCYRCSKSGHIADQCIEKPKSRKCFRCGSDRHLAKECAIGRSGESSRPVKVIAVDDEFEKIVSVDNKQMMALIDSGSRVTTMKCSFSQKFGNRQPVDLMLKGFEGRRIRVTEKVVAVLKVDDIEENVEFVVVPNFAQDLPVIVGKDVLKRDSVLLTKKDGKVWLAKGERCVDAVRDLQAENIVHDVCSIVAYEPITEEDLNMDEENMTKKDLLKCVVNNRDCFSKSYRELGKAKCVELDIVLQDNTPVYEKPYKMEFAREVVLNKIVDDLLRQESSNRRLHPIVVVPRLCRKGRRLSNGNRLSFPKPQNSKG